MSMETKSAGRCDVSFTVNGTAHTVSVYPMERLLDVLRNALHLTGTKEGCGEGNAAHALFSLMGNS